MVKRKHIALIYRFNYEFSAGIVIYIQNLVKGFKLLEDQYRPHLTIIYSPDSPIQEIKEIDYPYIDYYKYKPLKNHLLSKAVNKLSSTFLNTYLWKKYDFPIKADIIYPYQSWAETFNIKHRYYWKPDFQEMYYPEYVSKQEYEYVINQMKYISENDSFTLIVSSQDSLSDYKKFFGPYKNKVKVLRFISLLPGLLKIDNQAILKKYGINKHYFMVSNQFWPHKNHQLILEAIVKLKEKHSNFFVLFSGVQSTYRDNNYFSKLQVYINDQNIKDYVRFVGFIPREEQLVLMNQAISVIQPSLFEGWSTIIEDCKALNQFVLAGDLAVNKEQINVNCEFFDRKSPEELSQLMEKQLQEPPKITDYDYSLNISQFKQDLIEVFGLNY